MKRTLATLLLVVVLLVAGCQGTTPTAEPTPEPVVPTAIATPTVPPAPASYEPLFQESPCPFPLPPDEVEGDTVRCGFVVVPEDRQDPGGARVRLAVVVLKSQAANPKPDPVMLLSGGPGEKTVDRAVVASMILAPFRDQRDLIVFDQRGVGLSEPALDCPEVSEVVLAMHDTLDVEAFLQANYQAHVACHERLVAEGHDLAAYNTEANAADVNDIRRALGYDQYNLYGGSYGTLLAQAVMREHPEGLRSVILGAVLPADQSFFVHVPRTAVDATLHLLERCAADPACNEAYPDLEQVLYDTIDRLNDDPVTIPITNPKTGETQDGWLTGDDVFSNLVVFLYQTEIIPVLPQAIYDVANGDYDLMTQLSNLKLVMLDLLSRGMEFSVMCAADLIGLTPADYLEVRAQMPGPLAGKADPEDIIQYSFFGICEQWNVPEADARVKQPVVSDIPTLALTGEFDPVTPPEYAEAVVAHLENAWAYEFPNIGHNILVASSCARRIARDFLNNPDREPDAGCIDETPPLAFDLPKEASGSIVMEPVSNQETGLQAVAPAGWTRAAPGTFLRQENSLDQTALVYEVLPMPEADVVQLLTAQLSLDSRPEPQEQREANGRTWTFYSVEVQGTAVEFAITAWDDSTSWMVLLQCAATERDSLVEAVLLPAVDALRPLNEIGVQSPTDGQPEIVMEPFSSEAFGIEGVVPSGWTEIAPGAYNRGAEPGDLARLIQQAAPGTTATALGEALLPQLGLASLPEPSEGLETASFTWTLYQVEVEAPGVGAVLVDLALAEREETAYLVLLQALADDYPLLHEQVFLPAVKALALPGDAESDEATYQDPAGLYSVPIPAGWSLEESEGYVTLASPDGDLKAYVLTVESDDLEAAVARGWTLVDPGFDLAVEQVVEEPVTNGAERAITIVYDSGDEDTRVLGGGWLHEGIAYLELFSSTVEALQKRYFQLQIISTGYDIKALDKTDLSQVKPLPLDKDLLAQLETYIQEKMVELDVVGAAVAIVQDGQLAYSQGFGLRDLESQEPATPETLMMIGSTTKSLTTMLMAGLVDDGAFQWDTPVVEILPSFRVSDPQLSREITMRNLVCACTGLPRRDLEWLFNADQLDAEDIVASLADFEFFTDFGEAFQYSNQMVASAGYLAALAAGGAYGKLDQAYLDLMQDRVFDPMDMESTTFSWDEVLASDNYALPYASSPLWEPLELSMDVEETLSAVAPAGAAWSNVLDMARYLVTELNQGVTADGTRVASAANLALTWEPQVDITADASYGLGWIVEDYKGLRVISHAGNTFGFTSELAFLPDHGLGISILINQRASGLNQLVRYRLLELLFQQPAELEAVLQFQLEQLDKAKASRQEALQKRIERSTVAPYLGTYANDTLGEMTLSWQNGNLFMDVGEFQLQVYALKDEQGEVTYANLTSPVEGMPLAFEKDEAGRPSVVYGVGVVEYRFSPVP